MKCEAGFGFQDLLLITGLKSLTGELVIESGNNIGSMIFQHGKILQAFSPYCRAIGDVLVDKGMLTEEELLQTLHEQKQTGLLPIGSMLVQAGKVDFETIELMVHEQIRQAVRDFLSWQKLNVSFVEKDVTPVDSIHLPVHEFIAPDTLHAARSFGFTDPAQAGSAAPTQAAAPLT